MADVQILAAAAASAPEHYEVPNTQEIIPKAVAASFDGSGASGSFVALCEIVSDAGIVVAQGKSDTIAAGGSAYVSWFPGGGLGGGSALALDWGFYELGFFASIPSGTTYNGYPFELQGTSNSSVFAQALGTDGVAGPQLNAAGVYVAQGVFSVEIGQLDLPSNSAAIRYTNTGAQGPYGLGLTDAAPFEWSEHSDNWFAAPSLNALINVGTFAAVGSTYNVELWQNSGSTITQYSAALLITRVNPTAGTGF